MSTTSGPFARPDSVTDPGLGRVVWVAAIFFVLGLVTVGLVYMAGDSAEAPVAAEKHGVAEVEPAIQPDAADPPQTSPTQDKPYVAANGASPLPKHGEGVAPPIPAERLITQEAYEADPPQASTLPAPDGPVAWTEAHKYLGQTITVKGTIVDTNNIGQICFLNYDPDWQGKFYIAMFSEAFKLLPDPPEEHYLNRTLLVTGKVTLHRDRPQIEVRDLSQVETVE